MLIVGNLGTNNFTLLIATIHNGSKLFLHQNQRALNVDTDDAAGPLLHFAKS